MNIYNVFNLPIVNKTYQTYGDILENKPSYDLSTDEQRIYEAIKESDRQRLLKFG